MAFKMNNPQAERALGAEVIQNFRDRQIISNPADTVEQFRRAMHAAGINFDDEIIADGRLHRGHVEGDAPGSKNLAYKLHLDGLPAGYFEHFKSGIKQNWKAHTSRRLTQQEVVALQARIDEERRQREIALHEQHENAAARATHLWNASIPAKTHPYLVRKRIKPHGVRVRGGSLVIPLYDKSDRIVSLQFIDQNGNKRFLSGGKKHGCFFEIGNFSDPLLIAEGFATSASLYEELGHCVIVAFDAHNLRPVAEIMRARHPKTEIIICGDNDLSGVGQRAAHEAASAVDGRVLIPDEPGCDWNDFIVGARHG
jgi:putative DNA primase/helicase